MKDYRTIFSALESTLVKVASRNLPEETIRQRLEKYKHFEGKTFTDAEFYWKLVCVIFYSGFKAATVNAKIQLIRGHFPDYETVANYTKRDINRIINDEDMISNQRKINACVENAKTFRSLVKEHGSFQKYIDSFSPGDSFENLMLLKEELEYRFEGFGKITTYHFLTDIGMPVIKPDRVICRIFKRLGLIESDEQLLKTVIQGRKFAEITGNPIRYVDIVFVVFGQVQSLEFGIERGICLESEPSCRACGLTPFCNYQQHQARNTRSS